MLNIDCVITNGLPSNETLNEREKNGYKLVSITFANEVHPFAMQYDRLVVFAKYAENKTKESVGGLNGSSKN